MRNRGYVGVLLERGGIYQFQAEERLPDGWAQLAWEALVFFGWCF